MASKKGRTRRTFLRFAFLVKSSCQRPLDFIECRIDVHGTQICDWKVQTTDCMQDKSAYSADPGYPNNTFLYYCALHLLSLLSIKLLSTNQQFNSRPLKLLDILLRFLLIFYHSFFFLLKSSSCLCTKIQLLIPTTSLLQYYYSNGA